MSDPERPHEEIVAANAFREAMIPRADAYTGPYPLWHGFSLMEAFFAGIDYARKVDRPASNQNEGQDSNG
jgi:hypothetical protein